MIRFVIIATVVLMCQSAKVPQEVTHQVSAVVPSNVLASAKAESPAQVVEVVKDGKPITEAFKKVIQNAGKPVMLVVEEVTRKTRAVETTGQPEVEAMRTSVDDAVSKTQTKAAPMPTMQPEMKTTMPAVGKVTTVPEVDKKAAVMSPVPAEMKPVVPAVVATKRKTRAVMTTGQPEVKTVKPTTAAVAQVEVKPAVVTTKQPETKTVMPTGADMKRKARAVPFSDNDSKRVHHSRNNNVDALKAMWATKERNSANKMHSHRWVRSAKVEITTDAPVSAVVTVAAKQNMAVKTSDSASSKSSIDPCDLLCTKFEFYPICASNGLCLHEFPNQCILDTFNCKHPKATFTATRDDSCQMSWLTKCEESDMV